MLERRAPLAQVAGAGDATIDAPGLRVAAVADRGLLLLQGDPDDPLLAGAIREQVRIGLPGPLEVGAGGDCALLWMTPKELLLELPAARAPAMETALALRLGAALAAVTDVSDAFASFDVGGDAAVDVLMTGCTLDLRPHAFAPNRVARTAFAGVSAIIWKPADPNRFRCLVDRSFAWYFWNRLGQTLSPAGERLSRGAS